MTIEAQAALAERVTALLTPAIREAIREMVVAAVREQQRALAAERGPDGRTRGAGQTHFLTVDEAAELLRIKPRTIRAHIERGTIPYRKVGRRVVFSAEELVEWTAKGTR